MANGSDYNFTNQQILDLLNDEKEKRPDYIRSAGQGTGSALYDFLGQAAWGAATELSLSTLEAWDIAGEATAAAKGEDYTSWEHYFTGGYEQDWDRMSGWARAGEMVGRTAGMLPWFGGAGKLAGKGIVAGTKKVGMPVAKWAAEKSTKELVEAGTKFSAKEGISIAKTLTDDAARTIVDDAYKWASDGNSIKHLLKSFNNEVYENSMAMSLKKNIASTLKIADKELLDDVSREVVKIVAKNNPENAMKALTIMTSKIPGLSKNVWAPSLLAASGYDAAIGLVLGAARSGAQTLHKVGFGVEKNEWGEYEHTGNRELRIGEEAGNWLYNMVHEAAVFSLIGPVKFIKGGTNANHISRANKMFQGFAKSWKPLDKYTNYQLRKQLTAMDEISGGAITRQMAHKFRSRPHKWWLNAKSKADTKDMKEFLSSIRKKFIYQAPTYFFKEFGTDMVASLPRMVGGVVMMNAFNLFGTFREHGFGWEQLGAAMGQTPQEQLTNVLTAAYFTRTPHSFHMEVKPTTMNKIMTNIFQTGKVNQYIKFKKQKLRAIEGSLSLFGQDAKTMQGVINAYSPGDGPNTKKGDSQKVFNKFLDETTEFSQIRELIDQNKGASGAPGTTDLKTAFNKRIADMVKNGDITYEESLPLYEKLYIAEKLIQIYNNNTFDPISEQLNSFLPERALDTVKNLSSITFDGESLNYVGLEGQLNRYMDRNIVKATMVPQNLLKQFILEVYEKLNIPIPDPSPAGVYRLPRISDIVNFGKNNDLDMAIASAYEAGIKNNWIDPQTPPSAKLLVLDEATQGKILDVFNKSNERFMELVHRENWESSHNVDPMIMMNDAWTLTMDRLLQHRQRVDAYEMFAGTEHHNKDIRQVEQLRNSINRFLMSKKAPELIKSGDIDIENIGEVEKFIGDLHRVVRNMNPNVRNNRPHLMTQEQASALYDLIAGKEGTGGLTGDLFTNRKTLGKFEGYILDRSMDKLGMNDMLTGIGTKAGLHTLIGDPTFNYQDRGAKAMMPDFTSVNDVLTTNLGSKKITQKTYDELIEYYEDLVNTVSASKFPIDFRSNLEETVDGEWSKALSTSLALGKRVMDSISHDRAARTVNELDRLLASQQDKATLLNDLIEFGADNIDETTLKKYQVELKQLIDDRQTTNILAQIIKTALIEKDVYILRAASRKEGDILQVIKTLESLPMASDKTAYMTELLKIKLEIEASAQNEAFTEESLAKRISEEMQQFRISDKDVQEDLQRITVNQFSHKYNIPMNELNSVIEIYKTSQRSSDEIRNFARNVLGSFYDVEGWTDIGSPQLRGEVQTIVNTLKAAAVNVSFDPTTSIGQSNFKKYVTDILRLKMELSRDVQKDQVLKDKMSDAQIDTDLYQIATNYFSKRAIKTVKVDLQTKRLIQDYKPIGEVKDRGFGGILEALDPSQNNIYLVERGGINSDGSIIRDVTGDILNRVNAELQSGDFSIENPIGKREYYKTGSTEKLADVNRNPGDVGGELYRIVKLNEKTSVAIRVDQYSQEALRKNIRIAFAAENKKANDPGGELFQRILAIYDGDLSLYGAKYDAIRTKLNQVRKATTIEDLVEAVKLTRLVLNMPLYMDKVVDGKAIDLDHSLILDLNKRDPLTETKNGYVPTSRNRQLSGELYKYSKSELHNKAYDEVKDWFENPDKKLRVLSIDDTGDIFDRSGNKLINIFNSFDRAKIELDVLKKSGDIDEPTYKAEVKRLEEVSKSIVDGEMFLGFKPYLASMMMVGLHEDMVHTNLRTGEIEGFRAGGIKPTISWSNVITDKADPSYGRVQQWFGKTAFKYDAVVAKFLNSLGADALTFKSANKINGMKNRGDAEITELYAESRGLTGAMGVDKNLSKPWIKYVDENFSNFKNVEIVEVPLDAMSLRNISREHDPLVGQNAGVHMNHKNGIREWIDLDTRLERFNNSLTQSYTNVLYRSRLAQQVMGTLASSGDPSMANSALSSILLRKGLVLEPWAQRRMEDNLIKYYLNNGAVAGGVVEDGSLDVMGADMGNLKISIRSNVQGRPTVQYFGEFLPSYYAAQKKFKVGSDAFNRGVQNVLIQKVQYASESGPRKADGFLIEIKGEKFLQIEGRYIDKDGALKDADTFKDIKPADEQNKITFNEAVKSEAKVYDFFSSQTGQSISENTLAEVSRVLSARFRDKAGNMTMHIGMLNSRQPRNMMGDIVISKMAVVGHPETGQRIYHVDKESGNVSRMNHADAIKPQDADFDFDKSFNYVAAPAEFWRESNKLAGHITGVDPYINVKEIFNVNRISDEWTKKLAPTLSADEARTMLQTEVDNARGKFIKMHQTVTYLANIFRNDPYIIDFKSTASLHNLTNLQVRFNNKHSYATTVEQISEMAKRYIDLYENLPSKSSREDIERIQDEIIFGSTEKGTEGLFSIYHEKEGKLFRREGNLSENEFGRIKDAIKDIYIKPINSYLRYNKGMEVDPGGWGRSATLENYHSAYTRLMLGFRENRLSKYEAQDINLRPGLRAAIDYFDTSRNPYDTAMRSLSQIYDSQSNIRKEGLLGKRITETEVIQNYIESGHEPIPGEKRIARENRIFESALKEYVKDESRMLRLVDLQKQLKSITIEIESKANFIKDKETNTELIDLRKRKIRIEEIIEEMTEAISYQFAKDPLIKPFTLPNRNGWKAEGYVNNRMKPLVIVDAKGDIREVIRPGRTNRNAIKSSDKIIENGKRFEITDGEQQEGLRILFEAFSGLPHITTKDGSKISFSSYEMSKYIKGDYNKLVTQIIADSQAIPPGQRGIIDKIVERERGLHDYLFKGEMDESYRTALILRLLMPHISDKVISVRSINEGTIKKAQYDYLYMQNALSEPIMSLLTKMSTGEYKGDRAYAEMLLNDINNLKTIAYMKSKFPNVDIRLLESRITTEPASLEGYMTDETFLNQRIFYKQDMTNDISKRAAKIMVDYAQGAMIDPVLMYHASKVMTENGIPLREQWARTDYRNDDNGKLRFYGSKPILINEVDAIRRKNLGEHGATKESTVEAMKQLYNCYK